MTFGKIGLVYLNIKEAQTQKEVVLLFNYLYVWETFTNLSPLPFTHKYVDYHLSLEKPRSLQEHHGASHLTSVQPLK